MHAISNADIYRVKSKEKPIEQSTPRYAHVTSK